MNEETLGMIVGFLVVAPIAAFVVSKIIKKRAGREPHANE